MAHIYEAVKFGTLSEIQWDDPTVIFRDRRLVWRAVKRGLVAVVSKTGTVVTLYNRSYRDLHTEESRMSFHLGPVPDSVVTGSYAE